MRKDLAIYLVHKTIGLGLSDDRSIIFYQTYQRRRKEKEKRRILILAVLLLYHVSGSQSLLVVVLLNRLGARQCHCLIYLSFKEAD